MKTVKTIAFGLVAAGLVYLVLTALASLSENPSKYLLAIGWACGCTAILVINYGIYKNEPVARKFFSSKKELFDHVGFTPDWVEYAIDDCTDMYWRIYEARDVIAYAKTKTADRHSDDYYEDNIYHQRFYKQWVFTGKDYTMVFCDPRTDGIQWFRVFDNKKEIV